MALLLLSLLSLLLPALAQQCQQYSPPLTSTTCLCPPGFSGPSCALPACGGNLFEGSARTAQQPASGQLYGNISSCACEDGWAGEGCNVCRTQGACEAGFWASNYNSTVGGNGNPGDLTGVDPGETGNDTVVCNTGGRVYASGELSCDVDNPTLQALYPLQSVLTILRVLSPSLSLYPNVSSLPVPNATVYAQLWYAGVEQFFCSASACSQTLDGSGPGSSDWLCQDLHCTCRPNATFCGAVPVTDLTATIDGLSGTLEIACQAANETGGTTCAFRQAVLEQLFGAAGLSMQNCIFGECVRQYVIDQASNNGTTAATSEGPGLSGGVIAGLAVVGAFVLAAIALVLFGWLGQRRARRAVPGTAEFDEKSPGAAGGVGMEWTDLSYLIPAPRHPFRRRPARGVHLEDAPPTPAPALPTGEKVILSRLSGRIAPGQMVAILGPSGAGKTTLVELLAGKRKAGRASGAVSFFSSAGQEVPRPRVGFVDQSDILPPNLTVAETLLFAARLRLPESMPDSAKRARVDEVMLQLGLGEVAETRIGSGERRGVSGGEMRRVSIGCELVARPGVLILDEPTSGLDSVSALRVASLLHSLAHDPSNPTLILASIHQPSSTLYRTFDAVLVLSAGRTLYFGPGGQAPARWAEGRGRGVGEGVNVADHLLEMASGSGGRGGKEGGGEGVGEGGGSGSGSLEAEREGEHTGNGVNGNGVAGGRGKAGRGKTGILESGGRQRTRYAATFFTQLQVLSGREWKNLRRDLSLFVAHMLVAAVLGVFTGGLYFHTGITIAGFQSRIGCLFFLGSLLSFSALSALHNLVEIRPLFLRERAGAYYSPTAWLLSRVIWDVVPLRIIPTIVVSTITYWMAGLSPEPANFFKFLLILVLYALVLTLFNFLYGSVFSNGGIAILLSALFNLAQMTFAGFFVHLDSIPPVLRWLQWLCPLKYTLEALSVNEVNSGLMIQDTLQGVPVDVSAQLIMNLLFGFGDGNYYRDVLVLFAFIVGFGGALVGAVWFRLRETR